MLGRQPIEIVEDQRIWLIFVASLALDPGDKDTPFDDLKSDLATPDFETFLKRIQTRWPRALDGSDAKGARAKMLRPRRPQPRTTRGETRSVPEHRERTGGQHGRPPRV